MEIVSDHGPVEELAGFTAAHGDPSGWSAAELDVYLGLAVPASGNPGGPRGSATAGTARPEDQEAREVLGGWFAEHAPMVVRVVRRALRHEDGDLAEDLAQDVWLAAFQYLLRGNEVARPKGLLAVFARRRVCAHYRLARVRRERPVDLQDEAAVVRLAEFVGAAA